jgi:hypothetical protein
VGLNPVPGWLAGVRCLFLGALWATTGWLGWLFLTIYVWHLTH